LEKDELFNIELKDIIDGLPEAFYVKDEEGKIVLANRAHNDGFLKANTDPKVTNVVGLTDRKILPDSPEDQLQKIEDLDEYIRDTGKTQYDHLEEITFQQQVHTVSTTKIRLQNNGNKYVAGLTRDISGRINLYRQLFDSFPGCVFITKADGQIQRISDNGAIMFGFSSEKDMGKKNLFDLVHSEVRKDFLSSIKSSKLTNENDTFQMNKKDGTSLQGQFCASVRWGGKDNSKIIGYHGTITDVTIKKEYTDWIKEKLETAKICVDNIKQELDNKICTVLNESVADDFVNKLALFSRLNAEEKELFFLLSSPSVKPETIVALKNKDLQWLKGKAKRIRAKLDIKGRNGIRKFAARICPFLT